MKKSLLITTSLLTVGLVTGIYAQTTGATSSIVDKMKAVAHSFTLSTSLNPTDTGITSDPVKGKKTGDILTAGEWNRMLELVSEGGGSGGLELWKCTCGGYMNMVTTSNLIYGETCIFGNGGTANNVQYSSWSCTKIPNSGNGSGGSGWVDVPLTDTADYDTSCEYRFGINFLVDDINRKWLNATSASGYPMILSTKFLGVGFTGNNLLGIPSNNKSQYGYRDSAGVFTLTTNVSISSVQKRCGSGSSGSNIIKGTAGVGFTNGQTTSSMDTINFGRTCNNPVITVQSTYDSVACGNGSGPTTCTSDPGTNSQDLHAYFGNVTSSGFQVYLSTTSGVWVGASSPVFNVNYIVACD